ncbi:sulfotransferase family cytosolic 1B member 1-like [Pecten maximus]|uniref:sulfotransferase family cytosolic 1B member 1-like n=1 Tax=Pecten maximus TaxID=6579 RepID=UPI0014583206|nr:sulfotransferase family cytosolic 1B member 1-like [Pecten maximus]
MAADNISNGLVPDWRYHVDVIEGMNYRDDDVFMCAFPKAGTHWIWEITTMLLDGRPEYSPVSKVTSMLEFSTTDELDRLTSPRLFNTHLPYKLLPSDAVRKGAKIIFLQRNPKDIAVSYYSMLKQKKNAFPGNFNDWNQLFLFHPGNSYLTVYPKNWFEYTLEWEQVMRSEQRLNLHMIYYENLKQNPVEEITRLSRFLGSSTETMYISEVANKCSFRNMKKANIETKDLSRLQGEKTMFDSMFRKGEVGDWKNWFTVAQNELFDKVHSDKMRECSFLYQYTV